MDRYKQIAAVLTCLTALLGAFVGILSWPWWPAAVAGVCAGLWWAFGRQMMGLPDNDGQPTKTNVTD